MRKEIKSLDQLSLREQEIVILITQGHNNKEIAERMLIVEQTVKNCLHNLFGKLGVSDRLELALYAIYHFGSDVLKSSTKQKVKPVRRWKNGNA